MLPLITVGVHAGLPVGVAVAVAVGVAVAGAVGVAVAVALAIAVAVAVGVGEGAATLTVPIIPKPQCATQKYEKLPASAKVNSYTNPVLFRIPASQFMLSGEQNSPSAVQGSPLVTL